MEAEKQTVFDESKIIKFGNTTQEELEIKEEQEEQNKKNNLKKIAQNYIRIRDDYYKIVFRPDKSGKLYKDLLKLSKTTITDDYSKAILKHISKFDDFTLVASHTNYQQSINGFYNQYHEITHIPK